MKIRLNRNRWRAGFLAFQTLGGLLRKKPKVPSFTPIDAGAEQRKAIGGNIQAFPQLEQLGGLYNQYSQNAIMQGLRSTLGPDVSNILTQGSQNILAMLRGQIPQDVQNAVQNSAAARALGGGYQGSGMFGNLVARDLGRTSLDLQAQGQAQALPWFALGRQLSPTFDVGSMFVSPAQQIAVAQENQARQFSTNWLRNQIKAAYDPSTIIGESIIKTDDQIMQIIASLAGSASGALMGGGGGASAPNPNYG